MTLDVISDDISTDAPDRHSGGWTDDRVELLKKLWLEGLSCSQIAGILGEGVTRNAVIGKVSRLKLPPRNRISAYRPPPKTMAAARVTGKGRPGGIVKKRPMGGGLRPLSIEPTRTLEAEPVPVVEIFIPVSQRLTLLQLSEDTCKWPIGDPLTPDFYFCGGQPEDTKPYCEFHSRRAYHQVEKVKP